MSRFTLRDLFWWTLVAFYLAIAVAQRASRAEEPSPYSEMFETEQRSYRHACGRRRRLELGCRCGASDKYSPTIIHAPSEPDVKSDFVPPKIALSFYALADEVLHRRELADPADIKRVWTFVKSHMRQPGKLPPPSPPNLTIEFRDTDGQLQKVLYQQGVPGFTVYGRFGFLNPEQQEELSTIVQDYLGDNYYPAGGLPPK